MSGSSASSASDRNGSRPSATVQELRAQIARDRQELTETFTALQAKTDVKAQAKEKAREKIADVEIAASKLTTQVGRTVSSATDKVRDAVPRPVVTQAERVSGFVRRETKLVVAGTAAALAAILAATAAVLRRHGDGGGTQRWGGCKR